jgi:uncharacterized protein (DUF2267 family)
MARDFKHYSDEAQKFVELLAVDLGCPQDIDKTKRILKAVLHTIRDRIIIAESFQLLAQLPMLIKGLYVENWKYTERPSKFRTKESLLQALIDSEHLSKPHDFPNETFAIFALNRVLKNISRYISPGEMKDIVAELPTEIQEIIDLTI